LEGEAQKLPEDVLIYLIPQRREYRTFSFIHSFADYRGNLCGGLPTTTLEEAPVCLHALIAQDKAWLDLFASQ